MLEHKLACGDEVFDQFPVVETSLHLAGLLIGFGAVLVYSSDNRQAAKSRPVQMP